MKRIFCALMLACMAIAPAGCTTPSAGPTGIIAKADHVIMTGARAFAAAELAYISAAQGLGILADNGVIRGSLATELREKNAVARTILIRGKATSDAAQKAAAAAELFGIVARFDEIKASASR